MGQVLSKDQLSEVLSTEKGKGRKIVFTNGCFDIIHAGHVRYLKQARALGDLLVVGLNSDASVSTLKPGRPVNSEAHRAEVLAALLSVDYVCLFSDDTPYELISLIRPDILVKGGDWKKEDIVGSDIVPETHSLSFVDGISTTSIIERIQKLK
jgi:rfaE bifunctional protein nucleotidyltransferase chain/domain